MKPIKVMLAWMAKLKSSVSLSAPSVLALSKLFETGIVELKDILLNQPVKTCLLNGENLPLDFQRIRSFQVLMSLYN